MNLQDGLQNEGQNSEGNSPPPPPPPTPDPRDEEIRLLRSEMTELKSMISHQAERPPVQAPQSATEPTPEFKYYSTRDIAKAQSENDFEMAEEMRAHNSRTALEEKEFNWGKRLKQMEQYGGAAINDINLTLAAKDFPHMDIPEVKKAFDAQVKQLQANGTPLNKAGYEYIYNQAVGANASKVFEKYEKEKETRLRKQQPPEGHVAPGNKAAGRTSGSMGDEGVPTPEEELGAGGMAALRMANLTPDDEARRRGFRDFKEWAKDRAKKRAAA